MGRPRRPRRRAVPDGPRPSGDERCDLTAGRRLPYHRYHDPGGDCALRAGDGRADAYRRQARRSAGAPSGICDRPLYLRGGLGAYRCLLERHRPHPRLVSVGGDRRRPGAAGDGRARRRQLPRPGPCPRLRSPRRGRWRRDCRRPDLGGLGDDRAQLAGRLCGRGRSCSRHFRRPASARRGKSRARAAGARLGRKYSLGAWSRAGRPRCA